jgi:hypothetical protein
MAIIRTVAFSLTLRAIQSTPNPSSTVIASMGLVRLGQQLHGGLPVPTQCAADQRIHRWPSRHWAIKVAWTQIVAPGREPARLLPLPGITRRRTTRRGSEAAALQAVPPASPHNPGPEQTMAPPPRRLALDSGPDRRRAGRQGPARTGLTKIPATRRPGKTRPDRGNRRTRRDSRTPNLPANRTT